VADTVSIGVTPPGADEAALLGRVRARDVSALKELYYRYHARLSHFLLSLTRRPQVIGDLINDSMMVVWEKPRGWRRGGNLSTWIFGIAFRNALKTMDAEVRPDKDDQVERSIYLTPAADIKMSEQGIEGLLMQATGNLSLAHRAIVECTYFHGMGYLEIAETLQCSADTVMNLMSDVRPFLKRRLISLPEDSSGGAESGGDLSPQVRPEIITIGEPQ
jgi:RNA polymerase sigma factor (sigma-70 family)